MFHGTKKLLIADTLQRANDIAKRLNLSEDEYHLAGIGSGLFGRKFADIIDLSTDPNLFENDERNRRVKWLLRAYTHKARPAEAA